MNTTLYGVQISPFSRKVILALEAKGVEYVMEQTTIENQPENFALISPLGKIPGFKDDTVMVSDSTVICEYLEDRYPEVSLYLNDPAQKARVRWFEEFADTVLLGVAGALFYEVSIKKVLGRGEPDQERIESILNEAMPKAYDYLESQLTGEYLVGEQITMADISIVAELMNVILAGHGVDGNKWPKLAAYMQTMLAKPLFANRQKSDSEFLTAMLASKNN